MMTGWPLIMLLVVFVWAMVATVLLLRIQQKTAAQQVVLSSTQNDLRALCNAAVSVGERVNRLEKNQRMLDRRQNELGQRQDQIGQGNNGDQPFEQAIKLAKKGATTAELIDVCGLSQGEAELVAMMQRFAED